MRNRGILLLIFFSCILFFSNKIFAQNNSKIIFEYENGKEISRAYSFEDNPSQEQVIVSNGKAIKFKTMPNPASESFNINILDNYSSQDKYKYVIVDGNGVIRQQKEIYTPENTIDISFLITGYYKITLFVNNNSKQWTLIKL